MKTRQDYIDGKCTHEEFYRQFVDAAIIRIVKQAIGVDRIKKSTDPHFNDIPLARWDGLAPSISKHCSPLFRQAEDFPTLASCVCIAKAAAKMLKEQAI